MSRPSKTPRLSTSSSSSSDDTDGDVPALELGILPQYYQPIQDLEIGVLSVEHVPASQLNQVASSDSVAHIFGESSPTATVAGCDSVVPEPTASCSSAGVRLPLSTCTQVPPLLEYVQSDGPKSLSVPQTRGDTPSMASPSIVMPSNPEATLPTMQSFNNSLPDNQRTLSIQEIPGESSFRESSSIPSCPETTQPTTGFESMEQLQQHAMIPDSSGLEMGPSKISVALIASDLHEREGSDFDEDENRFVVSPSSDESEHDSDTDIEDCSSPGAEVDCDPGVFPSEPNQALFAGSPITVQESFLSVLSFSQSEKLSGVGFVKLLKLIELHCPKPNHCSKSYSQILKYFDHVKTPMESSFYCNKCNQDLTSLTDTCQHCRELKPSVDQVITLCVKDQLLNLYARSDFMTDIQYRFNRQKTNENNYEDLYDGSVYRKEMEGGFLQERHNISFMWNTDGASPYDSSNLQIWPVFGVINELPPDKRFHRENLVLFAIFVGKGKPNPNILLKHVHPQVEELKRGFSVLPFGYVEPVVAKAKWLCGTCDSPAKAMIFNQKYFNGFYSCPKCLSRGEKSDRTEDVFVHPFDENVALRTDSGYEEDAILAAVSNVGVSKKNRISPNGIKGTTLLYLMVDSMIESTSIDPLHCLYLGVGKQFLELWFSKTHKGEQYSLYKVEKVVSSRLMSIMPPNFVKRMPSSLKQMSNWKAYEFMLMLFYYLLPALEGILGQTYFHNFKLFVFAVSLLNQESVSIQEKDDAKVLLKQFAKDFEELYTLRNASFNVHLVQHLPSIVEALGPLWCSSCFRFEDLNGILLSLIHGTRFVGSQIASHLFSFLSLPQLVHNMEQGIVKDYCKSILKKGKRVKIIECIKEKYFAVGRYSKLVDLPQWMSNLLQGFHFRTVFVFDRIKVKGMLVSSERYRRSNVTCSKFVRFAHDNDVRYGLVKLFVKLTLCDCEKNCLCHGEHYAIILHHSSQVSFLTANPPYRIKHIVKCERTETIQMVPVTAVHNVCFYIQMDDSTFLCNPLNAMEMYN